MIENLEAHCKRSREYVNRVIGQHTRYAHEDIRKRLKQARERIDLIHYLIERTL
jgi:hypothetical protein